MAVAYGKGRIAIAVMSMRTDLALFMFAGSLRHFMGNTPVWINNRKLLMRLSRYPSYKARNMPGGNTQARAFIIRAFPYFTTPVNPIEY
jgi:hypothetical protein